MPKVSKGKSMARNTMRKSKPIKKKTSVKKTKKGIGGGY